MAVEQSNGVINPSSLVHSSSQASQLSGQASETVIEFQDPSQPNTETAVEQSNGVIDPSSSAQSLLSDDDSNTKLEIPDKPLQAYVFSPKE